MKKAAILIGFAVTCFAVLAIAVGCACLYPHLHHSATVMPEFGPENDPHPDLRETSRIVKEMRIGWDQWMREQDLPNLCRLDNGEEHPAFTTYVGLGPIEYDDPEQFPTSPPVALAI